MKDGHKWRPRQCLQHTQTVRHNNNAAAALSLTLHCSGHSASAAAAAAATTVLTTTRTQSASVVLAQVSARASRRLTLVGNLSHPRSLIKIGDANENKGKNAAFQVERESVRLRECPSDERYLKEKGRKCRCIFREEGKSDSISTTLRTSATAADLDLKQPSLSQAKL